MRQESGLRQTGFAFAEGCKEWVIPGDRVRSLDFGNGEDVVKSGLDGGCVREETPADIEHSQETSELADGLGRGQAWRYVTRSGRGWDPRDEILKPRNEISGTRKTHLDGFRRMPNFASCVKKVRRCWSCSWGEWLKTRISSM